jgi:3-hydroxyisobutyrate dehydrogenase-like beta-hydroxyacid dehydrogenase
MEKIGLIGLGVMGQGIASNILKAGYPLTIYNRTTGKVKEFLQKGAKQASTPKQAAESSDILIIMVWDTHALKAVMEGPNGALAGAHRGLTVIDMSTMTPEISKWEAARLEEKGAEFLDAPVHGTKGEVHAGGLWLMAGGKKEVFEQMIPIFKVLCETYHYVGPTGQGSALKLCGNLYVSTLVAALCEALVLAVKAGIKPSDALQLWGESDFKSPLLSGFGKAVCQRNFDVSFHLRTMVKDTDYVRKFAGELGFPVPVSSNVHEIYKMAQCMGWGEENASAVIKLFEQMAGVEVKE